MTIEQAWDVVLAVEQDIARIVSQAVRAGRVNRNDEQDRCQQAMSDSVGLADRYDESKGTFAAYVLATLRRELLHGDGRSTDALDRVAGELTGEETAKPARASPTAVLGIPDYLSPLQKRVASLLGANRPIGQVARYLGMSTHGVRVVAGQVAAEIARRTKGEREK